MFYIAASHGCIQNISISFLFLPIFKVMVSLSLMPIRITGELKN